MNERSVDAVEQLQGRLDEIAATAGDERATQSALELRHAAPVLQALDLARDSAWFAFLSRYALNAA